MLQFNFSLWIHGHHHPLPSWNYNFNEKDLAFNLLQRFRCSRQAGVRAEKNLSIYLVGTDRHLSTINDVSLKTFILVPTYIPLKGVFKHAVSNVHNSKTPSFNNHNKFIVNNVSHKNFICVIARCVYTVEV